MIMIVLLMTLFAGLGLADGPVKIQRDLTGMTASMPGGDDPTREDTVGTFCHDFTTDGSVNYNGTVDTWFGSGWGIFPVGSEVIGFSYTDLVIEVYFNNGASYSNYASELWLGFSYDDGSGGANLVGLQPFEGVDEGPGVFGPVSLSLPLTGWYPPTGQDLFFGATSLWDDGTGLPAGTMLSGTVCVDVRYDESAVPNKDFSWGSIKALYR
jgi:hypothetical protein